MDTYGRKKTLLAALVVMTAAIFIPFFAVNLPMLAAGEFLRGMPWGVFQTLSTTYAVEVVPTVLRPIVTSFVCMCWGWGIFISSGVARGALEIQSDLAWRLPFGLQWIWPVPLFLVFLWAPESPWYLVRTGQIDQARVSIQRLRRKGDEHDTEHDINRTLATLVHTITLENRETSGATYFECFRGINRRRTEIVSSELIISLHLLDNLSVDLSP